jgi:hypothetical protein
MKRVLRFWKIVVLDTLAVILMVAALATGWLPGPGGIPLFLIGLSLLAINHTWAQRYIDILRDKADNLGDMLFIPALRVFYDVLSPVLVGSGIWLLVRHSAVWMVSVGLSCTFLGITLFLGNRGRWSTLKSYLKRKH